MPDEEQSEHNLELSEFEEFKLEMLKKLVKGVSLPDESSESPQELSDKSKD